MKNSNNIITIKDFEKKWGIHFTEKHTGKMAGMISLSTSVLRNEHCKHNCNIAGSICEHCYSARMHKMYKGLEVKTAINTSVLTQVVIPVNDWPLVNALYGRFEAFGDLNNVIQVRNYFNCCKRNKKTKWALWTKNPQIINQAIKAGYKKPSNLVIIVSSLFVNEVGKYKFDFIDKIFTVYDKKYAAENNIDINCGARNCLACNRCYHKTKNIEYVNELLK